MKEAREKSDYKLNLDEKSVPNKNAKVRRILWLKVNNCRWKHKELTAERSGPQITEPVILFAVSPLFASSQVGRPLLASNWGDFN